MKATEWLNELAEILVEIGYKGTREQVLNNIRLLTAIKAYDEGLSPDDYFNYHLEEIENGVE